MGELPPATEAAVRPRVCRRPYERLDHVEEGLKAPAENGTADSTPNGRKSPQEDKSAAAYLSAESFRSCGLCR